MTIEFIPKDENYKEKVEKSFERQRAMETIDLLAPVMGDRFIITGQVLKAGRTITVCQAEVYAVNGNEKKLVAQMTGTMMTVIAREGIHQ